MEDFPDDPWATWAQSSENEDTTWEPEIPPESVLSPDILSAVGPSSDNLSANWTQNWDNSANTLRPKTAPESVLSLDIFSAIGSALVIAYLCELFETFRHFWQFSGTFKRFITRIWILFLMMWLFALSLEPGINVRIGTVFEDSDLAFGPAVFMFCLPTSLILLGLASAAGTRFLARFNPLLSNWVTVGRYLIFLFLLTLVIGGVDAAVRIITLNKYEFKLAELIDSDAFKLHHHYKDQPPFTDGNGPPPFAKAFQVAGYLLFSLDFCINGIEWLPQLQYFLYFVLCLLVSTSLVSLWFGTEFWGARTLWKLAFAGWNLDKALLTFYIPALYFGITIFDLYWYRPLPNLPVTVGVKIKIFCKRIIIWLGIAVALYLGEKKWTGILGRLNPYVDSAWVSILEGEGSSPQEDIGPFLSAFAKSIGITVLYFMAFIS